MEKSGSFWTVVQTWTQSNHSLRNCQGGALRTRGTRNADLEVRSTEGEEILLRHQFIIGDVTTGLVSLGQLYQAGWKICGDGDELVLTDPNEEVNIPVHFRNKSFAIRAHVRAAEAGQELDNVSWKFEQWSQSMMRSTMRRLTAGEQFLMEHHFTKPWGPAMSILDLCMGSALQVSHNPHSSTWWRRSKLAPHQALSQFHAEGGSVWLYRRLRWEA